MSLLEIELHPTDLPNVYISTYGRGIWKIVIYNSNCGATKTITGNVDGIQHHEASSQINSTQIISAHPGTRIKYNSDGSIFLTPDFLAKDGTFF